MCTHTHTHTQCACAHHLHSFGHSNAILLVKKLVLPVDCGGKLCYNGGTLDLETCTCQCDDLYKGDHCEKRECRAVQGLVQGLVPSEEALCNWKTSHAKREPFGVLGCGDKIGKVPSKLRTSTPHPGLDRADLDLSEPFGQCELLARLFEHRAFCHPDRCSPCLRSVVSAGGPSPLRASGARRLPAGLLLPLHQRAHGLPSHVRYLW